MTAYMLKLLVLSALCSMAPFAEQQVAVAGWTSEASSDECPQERAAREAATLARRSAPESVAVEATVYAGGRQTAGLLP